jgi:hypothetical protein
MGRMKRRRSDPILMGEPSPSLARISKMDPEELHEHIAALQGERQHLITKIANLSNMQPRPDERIALLATQQARLAALIQAAQDRLSGKVVPERREHRERPNRDPRGYGYRSRRF